MKTKLDEIVDAYNKHNPAFPSTFTDGFGVVTTMGLSKREYFAAMAMQGTVMANDHVSPHHMDKGIAELHARAAVTLADALIAELNKEASDE